MSELTVKESKEGDTVPPPCQFCEAEAVGCVEPHGDDGVEIVTYCDNHLDKAITSINERIKL